MSKSHLIATCAAIVLMPPLIVAAMHADEIFVEDRKAGRLLYFSANH